MKAYLLAACLTILAYSASHVECVKKKTQASKFAVDTQMTSGRHVKVPFFNRIKSLRPSNKQKMDQSFKNLMLFLDGQISEALRGIPESEFEYFWSAFEANFREYEREFQETFIGLGGLPVDQFTFYAQGAIQTVYDAAKEASQNIREIDQQMIIKDSSNLIADMVETVEKSPASCLIKWADMTIDGETLNSLLVDVVSKLMVSDFGPALNIS